MIAQAKRRHIRLPRGYANTEMPPLGQKVVDVADMVKKTSKRAKKQVDMAMTISCKERMDEILKSNLNSSILFPNNAVKGIEDVCPTQLGEQPNKSPAATLLHSGTKNPLFSPSSVSSERKIRDVNKSPATDAPHSVCRMIDFDDPLSLAAPTNLTVVSVTPLKRSTESVVDGPPSKRLSLPIDATKLSNGVGVPTFISEQPRPCTPSKEAIDLTMNQPTSPTSTVPCSPYSELGSELLNAVKLERQRAFYYSPGGTDLVAAVHAACFESRKAGHPEHDKFDSVKVTSPTGLPFKNESGNDRAEDVQMEYESHITSPKTRLSESLNGHRVKNSNRPPKEQTINISDSDDTSCSYKSSSEQLSILNDKIIDLQRQLTTERKTVRVLRTELYSANDKLSRIKRIFTEGYGCSPPAVTSMAFLVSYS
ncbi:Putative BTB/POZ domain and WD-repeat protein R731 [Frankliniella fusca]|uniref:BTB/POZ domain and WD-repeat protein R731 n=1 Tax=Frankliniella fusca TaxID=407009 RepID=A0AAE1GX58_9NEOP|nr:Putative BTB/POZ domain and WD-repeat protein R731 [Frankliniella fusca]